MVQQIQQDEASDQSGLGPCSLGRDQVELAFAIVFILPVSIIGMILFYKIVRLRHESRRAYDEPGVQSMNGPTQASVEELLARAANLQKRIQNLEDIIVSDSENDGALDS